MKLAQACKGACSGTSNPLYFWQPNEDPQSTTGVYMHCRETHISQRRLQAVPQENDTVMLGSAPLSLHGADLLRFPTAESSGLLLLSSGRPLFRLAGVSTPAPHVLHTRTQQGTRIRGAFPDILLQYAALKGSRQSPEHFSKPQVHVHEAIHCNTEHWHHRDRKYTRRHRRVLSR